MPPLKPYLWLILVLLGLSLMAIGVSGVTKQAPQIPIWEYAGKIVASEVSVPAEVRDKLGQSGNHYFTLLVRRQDTMKAGLIYVDIQTYDDLELCDEIYIRP